MVNSNSLNSETDMIAAFALVETEDGFIEQCRGITQPIYIEAMNQYVGFLLVYGNTEDEEIYYKIYDADNDMIWSVFEENIFSSNAALGEIFEPYTLNAKPPVGDVSFDGLLNIQDVLMVINYILDIDVPTETEFLVADIHQDYDLNVADIVDMVGLILDIPVVKIIQEDAVEIRIQGDLVSIYSNNNVSGLQFELPGHEEIKSAYDVFTNNINGSLKTVMANINDNLIHDGELFTFSEDQINFNNLIVVDRSGDQMEYEIRYLPTQYQLSQNYPNQFNPETTIAFELPEDSEITITVYDINGRLINTLLDNNLVAGYHSISWEAVDRSGLPLSNGIYFYRLITPQYTDVKKMLLIK